MPCAPLTAVTLSVLSALPPAVRGEYFLDSSQKKELLMQGRITGRDGAQYDVWIVPGYDASGRFVREGWKSAGKELKRYEDPQHYRDMLKVTRDVLRYARKDVISEFEFLLPGIGKMPDVPTMASAQPPEELGKEAVAILGALGPEERHIDEIIRICGLPPAKVSSSLLQLELRRLVRPLPGKFFVRLN